MPHNRTPVSNMYVFELFYWSLSIARVKVSDHSSNSIPHQLVTSLITPDKYITKYQQNAAGSCWHVERASQMLTCSNKHRSLFHSLYTKVQKKVQRFNLVLSFADILCLKWQTESMAPNFKSFLFSEWRQKIAISLASFKIARYNVDGIIKKSVNSERFA